MVVAVVRPRSATVHERHIEHNTRLRRSLQLLGASPFPSLQIWLPDLGIQVKVQTFYLHEIDSFNVCYNQLSELACLDHRLREE